MVEIHPITAAIRSLDYNEFLDDGTDEEIYKDINRTILYGNVIKISLIVMEGKYGAIDTDDSSCRCYRES